MKYILALIFFLAILLVINFLPPKRYNYTGLVSDEFEQPIAGIKLSFYFKGVDEVIKETETDKQGRFSLKSHYPSLEKVVLTKEGYFFSMKKTQEKNGAILNFVGKRVQSFNRSLQPQKNLPVQDLGAH